MQSTGHTSTHALSFVPMHGSQIIYATISVSSHCSRVNSRYIRRTAINQGSPLACSVNLDPARKSVVVAVVVRDGGLGITPTVIALAVVEVHQPETLRLETEPMDLLDPSGHDVAKRLRQQRVFRIVLRQPAELFGKRLGAPDRIGREVLDLRQKVGCLRQREDLSGIGRRYHPDDYNLESGEITRER